MYPCALRGGGPDIRMSGPFASLRDLQGAAPLAPLRGYPCPCGGLNIVPFDRFTPVGKAVIFISEIQN